MFTQLPTRGNDSSHTVEMRDRIRVVSASVTLDVSDQIIDCEDGTYTITLPPVSEAAGHVYSFYAPAAVLGDITIDDNNNDSRDFAAIGDILTAANDRLLLYSDGIAWWALQNLATP